ncbi:MAG: DUF4175 family protein [Alphaproteobacteria bacterium]|nr:DUF4175 family protein [Alphaproteobacteria bacterium]
MLDPLDFENRPLYDRLQRRRRAVWWSLLLENIALHLWRPVSWVLLFSGLWMFALPQALGQTGAIGTTIIFLAGLAALIKIDILTLKGPDPARVDKRMEQGNTLPQGQLALLEDDLANPQKKETRQLWEKAQKSILSILPNLKTPLPRALLPRQDPLGLRLIAILCFISGLMIAGPNWHARLTAGLFPLLPASFLGAEQNNITLLITPPEYTKRGQLRITGTGHYDKTLDIPEDSTLKIQTNSLFGKYAPPVLLIDDTKIPLKSYGDNQYGLELPARAGHQIKVRQLLITRATWDYSYILDQPPTIKLTDPEKPYEEQPGAGLRFPLTVEDDYGVTDLKLSLDLDPMVTDKPIGKPWRETRLLMSPAGAPFETDPAFNLSWHTWAGLPVQITFEAIDHKGQSAKLDPINLTLPERAFNHPLAKSLILMRKKLAWGTKDDFSSIASDLELFLTTPSLYQNNIVIFLALRTAASRLYYAQAIPNIDTEDTAIQVTKLLWDTAITVEDGNLSLAMRNLRDAQKALEDALRDPNTDEAKTRMLMENLREKMAEYFMEMQREIQKRIAEGKPLPMIPKDMLDKALGPDTLAEMMDKLESNLLSGDKQSAKDMLSRLQDMMDMMDPSTMNTDMPADMQMMEKGVSALQELIEKQEQLRDQTKAKIPEGHEESPSFAPHIADSQSPLNLGDLPPPPQETRKEQKEKPKALPSVDMQGEKADQQGLRYILGQLMMEAAEKLDKVPENLGVAEQDMRGAEKELGDNAPAPAVPHQNDAIEHLKEAQKQLSEQLKTRMQQMVVIGGGGSGNLDPLGRYSPDGDEDKGTGSNVKIPDEAERKRIEEILNVLRERSGDLARPPEEREYYRRLLRQF